MTIFKSAQPVPPLRGAGPSAAVYLALAGLLAGAGAAAGYDDVAALAVPVALVALGPTLVLRHRLEVARLRAAADAWIARGYENRAASRFAWRMDELTSARERRTLARCIRCALRELEQGPFLTASVLNRRAVRPHRALLAQLGRRLDDLDAPVRPSGVLAVRRLLTSAESPLYAQPAWTGVSTPLDDPLAPVAQALMTTLRSLEVA